MHLSELLLYPHGYVIHSHGFTCCGSYVQSVLPWISGGPDSQCALPPILSGLGPSRASSSLGSPATHFTLRFPLLQPGLSAFSFLFCSGLSATGTYPWCPPHSLGWVWVQGRELPWLLVLFLCWLGILLSLFSGPYLALSLCSPLCLWHCVGTLDEVIDFFTVCSLD